MAVTATVFSLEASMFFCVGFFGGNPGRLTFLAGPENWRDPSRCCGPKYFAYPFLFIA
jgi:hypothetical protein